MLDWVLLQGAESPPPRSPGLTHPVVALTLGDDQARSNKRRVDLEELQAAEAAKVEVGVSIRV